MHEETNLAALSRQQQFELITESNIKINGLSNINEALSVHYLIYRIDNLENGKHYIGQHKTENPLDKYMGSGGLIIQAIAKHGIEKFVKTILFDFNNFEEMNEKEKELVPLSACYPHDKTSYNLAEGGHPPILVGSDNGMYGHIHTLEAIKKMSVTNSGTKNKFWIHREQVNRCVFEDQFKLLLSQGWKKGRSKMHTTESRKVKHLGLKWIHNKHLRLEAAKHATDLGQFLSSGWELGRLPIELKRTLKSGQPLKWVFHPVLRIKSQVPVKDLQQYLEIGFRLGSKIDRVV